MAINFCHPRTYILLHCDFAILPIEHYICFSTVLTLDWTYDSLGSTECGRRTLYTFQSLGFKMSWKFCPCLPGMMSWDHHLRKPSGLLEDERPHKREGTFPRHSQYLALDTWVRPFWTFQFRCPFHMNKHMKQQRNILTKPAELCKK